MSFGAIGIAHEIGWPLRASEHRPPSADLARVRINTPKEKR